MSSFSHNYKYIDLTSSYDITPLDPYYLYVNPKDISLSINLPSISYLKGGGVSYKIYNLSDKYSLSIITNTKSYLLSPKDSVEITTIDSDYIFTSEESNKLFTYDPVIGICLLQTGGGTGKWCHVDRNGVPIVLPKNYFDNHPIYSKIINVTISEEAMVYFPKFYVKYETITSSNDPRGLPNSSNIRYISPIKLDGYHCHPAFMYNNIELDQIYIGTYLGYVSNKKLHSLPSTQPTVSTSFTNFKTYATNTGTGFMMISIYQWAVIQLLSLIRYKTSNIENYALYTPLRKFSKLIADKWTFIDGAILNDLKLTIWNKTGQRNQINTNIEIPYIKDTYYYIIDMLSNITSDYNLNDVFLYKNLTTNINQATYPSVVYTHAVSGTGDHLVIGGSSVNSGKLGIFTSHFSMISGHNTVTTRLAKI